MDALRALSALGPALPEVPNPALEGLLQSLTGRLTDGNAKVNQKALEVSGLSAPGLSAVVDCMIQASAHEPPALAVQRLVSATTICAFWDSQGEFLKQQYCLASAVHVALFWPTSVCFTAGAAAGAAAAAALTAARELRMAAQGTRAECSCVCTAGGVVSGCSREGSIPAHHHARQQLQQAHVCRELLSCPLQRPLQVFQEADLLARCSNEGQHP